MDLGPYKIRMTVGRPFLRRSRPTARLLLHPNPLERPRQPSDHRAGAGVRPWRGADVHGCVARPQVVAERYGGATVVDELRRQGYPVLTIDKDRGVSLVQPAKGNTTPVLSSSSSNLWN
jgi:hypothetical protein